MNNSWRLNITPPLIVQISYLLPLAARLKNEQLLAPEYYAAFGCTNFVLVATGNKIKK